MKYSPRMKRRLQVLAVCAGLAYYAQILVYLHQPTPKQIGDALIWAVNNRSISFLDRIFASGVSVDHRCSHEERPKGLELLWLRTIRRAGWCGLNFSFRDNTPLMLACHPTELKVAKYLLARGADPNAADDDGDTPLHRAAMYGNDVLVLLLLRYGANINAVNSQGDPPLAYARRMDNPHFARFLQQLGAMD